MRCVNAVGQTNVDPVCIFIFVFFNNRMNVIIHLSTLLPFSRAPLPKNVLKTCISVCLDFLVCLTGSYLFLSLKNFGYSRFTLLKAFHFATCQKGA